MLEEHADFLTEKIIIKVKVDALKKTKVQLESKRMMELITRPYVGKIKTKFLKSFENVITEIEAEKEAIFKKEK